VIVIIGILSFGFWIALKKLIYPEKSAYEMAREKKKRKRSPNLQRRRIEKTIN